MSWYRDTNQDWLSIKLKGYKTTMDERICFLNNEYIKESDAKVSISG